MTGISINSSLATIHEEIIRRPQISQIYSDQFLSCEQLAARWNKPVKWVYSNWRHLELPVMRLGQQIRFPLSAIEAWESSNIHLGEGN
jgi:predicted DNA-binding transcriptional regulator AlpA